jgi:cytidylate kinase
MLNKELAKLKDEDMKKVHMRAKRLQTRKKNEIMTNEENNFMKVKELKDKERYLKNFRFENKVKYNQEKANFAGTMDSWSH